MTLGARVVIAALFKKIRVIRWNSTLLLHIWLDALCDTKTKLDVFVALQAFDFNWLIKKIESVINIDSRFVPQYIHHGFLFLSPTQMYR